MVEILETDIHLEYALGHHLHCLVAQIPVHLRRAEHGWASTTYGASKAALDRFTSGLAGELAGLVAHLASDGASSVSGSPQLIDGGAHPQRCPDILGILDLAAG